ncbi:ABC transporter permease, partial [Candidatus Saccharibacteria bacterium]|nr:ABC transporter permease [Candidatus Saccharibacteria bacterium]
MFRRKTRTILTIFGITIGIFAFTVMGSMAEKINLLVSGGTKYYSDKVTVSQSDSLFISAPMDIKKAQEIAKVSGVKAVSANVYTSLSDTLDAVSFGPPASITGDDFKGRPYESFKITYSQGRELKEGDRDKVVVGSDLVKKLKAKVGGTVNIRGKDYQVVGIMNKTLTAPDNSVVTTLADAQNIYYNSLPELIRAQTKPQNVVNGFTVYVNQGIDPDELATKINKQVSDVKASGPKAFQEQIANATGIFNAILFGVALISLVVGGLSIINTMTMSISERTREIGIKKAIGAKTSNILFEYLTEAGLIGLFGGLLGWGLGALTVFTVNKAMENSGNIIFLLTTRISVFALAFAVILGIIAGFYPAYHAVKLNI